MVHVQLRARIANRKAAEVFPILGNFESFASTVEAVRSISVSQKQEGRSVSNWEVDFHGGIMRWTEEDVFLPDQTAIQFQQVEGDLDSFSGEWRVTDDDLGCHIDFSADFDLGVPAMSEVLEPIAEGALRENVRGIISSLLGAVEFE